MSIRSSLKPSAPLLPEWQVSSWLNTPKPITRASLRGKVVLVHAFQMLCPGCVAHGLPQAEKVWQTFSREDVAVVGLHTVFEHHEVTGLAALKAFVHEYRWSFPIGVDEPGVHGPLPKTMADYGLRGTPSLILLDREGRVRLHHFGRMDDLALGAALGQLVAEDGSALRGQAAADRPAAEGCTDEGCAVGAAA